MRTTLTLEEDVAAKLKAEVRRSGKPFKQVVNELLRASMTRPAPTRNLPPFRVKARDMGLHPGLNYDCISALIEQVEGPFHK